MANFDYTKIQKLTNFGRAFAGKMVGQPFLHYRVTNTSTGDVVASSNLVVPNDAVQSALNIKVTPNNSRKVIENEELHAATFELLMSSDIIKTEDILVQNDPVYGGNTMYCVAAFRPLKPVLAVRVEALCKIYRPQSNRGTTFSGPTLESCLPFKLVSGAVQLGAQGTTPAIIPCGVNYIGQIKNQKVAHLPLDTLTTWWYIYVPLLTGMSRIVENDIIECQYDVNEDPVRYRVHAPYIVNAGLRGCFLLCERATL